MQYFPSNLKFLRNKGGFTQAEIKYHLEIEPTTWSNYERGKSVPNLELFYKISKFFQVSEHDLLNIDLEKGKVWDDEMAIENGNLGGKVLGKVSGKVSENISVLTKNTNPKRVMVQKQAFEQNNEGLNKPNVYDISENGSREVGELIRDLDKLNTCHMLYVPGLGEGLHIRLKIHTDNMHPTIKINDHVIVTHLPKPATTLHSGQIFILLDKQEGLICNRVHHHEEYIGIDAVDFEGKEYLLENDNYKYNDFKRNLNDFETVFKVVEVQTRNMTNVEAVKLKMFDQFKPQIELLRRKK